MDGMSNDIWNGLGLGGTLVALIFALFRGWLVVRPVYLALVAERDYWRDAFFKEQAGHTEATAQNGALLRSAGELESKLVQIALDQSRMGRGGTS